MAEIKKDQERDELFRRIYKIATDLVHAGHVAEWDFKSYVLGTMFYRYISENFTAYINEGEYAAGNKAFDYAKMPDAEAETAREGLVQEKGFFILPSELFCNVLARADKDDNLNETLERVFNHIESSAASGDAENDFAGLFDDFDVNSKAIGETVAKRNRVLVELHLHLGQQILPSCLRSARLGAGQIIAQLQPRHALHPSTSQIGEQSRHAHMAGIRRQRGVSLHRQAALGQQRRECLP